MSFGLISLGLVFMAGLALASCAQHSFNAWRSKEWDDRVFAIGALSLTASILLALGYNNAPDADTYRRYYQWHAVLSRPFFLTWAYFVLRFAGFRTPWAYRVWLGAEGVKAVLLLLFLRTPYFFDIQSIGRAVQPWGEAVAFPVGQAHPLQFIQILMPLISLGFTLAGTVLLLRQRHFWKAGFLGLAITASVGTVLYDNLADWMRWPDVAIAELMVSVPVLFLGWASSDRLVQAVLTRRRLRESQGLLDAMLNSLRDGVVGLDLRGQVLWMNPAAQALSAGIQEDQALDLPRLLEPAGPGAGLPAGSSVQRVRGSERLVEPLETPLFDADGRPLGRLLLLRDVTRLLDLRNQVARGHQMKLIGELAAGLAHDLRNMLTSIRFATANLRSEPGEARRELDSIDAACERAAGLTRRLTDLGRNGGVKPVIVEARAALTACAQLLRPTLPAGQQLIVEDCSPKLCAWADPSLLESALLNLGLNARDANPPEGRISLAARAQDGADGRPGVLFEVRDQGPGIPPEEQARLFQAFVSSKGPETGTGLGLMMVQLAAESLNGSASVASRPGEGSAFRIWLPQPEPADAVLVLDDEPTIAHSLKRLLERLGRPATALTEPSAALDLLRREPGRFKVLISDLHMPGMGGRELLQRARALDPGLAVILSTGSAPPEGAEGYDAMLEKPFGLEELERALAKVAKRP